MIFFKFWPRLKTIFIPRSLKTMRNNLISPPYGPIQNCFFTKSSYLIFFSECLKIEKEEFIFLENTQYAGQNFYSLLSMLAIIFTTYSVYGQ
jgi:hypothetical protein